MANALVRVFSAARMLAIEAQAIVGGAVQGNNLILTRHNGEIINAGNVRGPQGLKGDQGSQGIQGIQGVKGDQGIQGIQGQTGPASAIMYHRTTLAANITAIGDAIMATAPARVCTNRQIRLTATGAFTPPSADTGIQVMFQRSVAGGAWTQVGASYLIAANMPYMTGFSFTFTDAPPSGSTSYRLRLLGHYANGQVVNAGSQFTVEDLGSV